jgi:hypothetical protein
MSYVRPQIIESPNAKKQRRITANLRQQAVRADKRDEKNRDKWAADLKPIKAKHPASYTRYWYAGGRTA